MTGLRNNNTNNFGFYKEPLCEGAVFTSELSYSANVDSYARRLFNAVLGDKAIIMPFYVIGAPNP